VPPFAELSSRSKKATLRITGGKDATLQRSGRRGAPTLPGIRCPNFVDARIETLRFAALMKTSTFRIVPLSTEVAEAAQRAAESGTPDHAILIADSPCSYPCRHCLRWAQPGERVILFPYSSIPPGHPYSEIGPIFVHAERCQRYSATDEYPADFRNGRAFRAYDANYNMIDAEIVNGREPEEVIERLFRNPKTAFVDTRSVSRGCFTFRIQRPNFVDASARVSA